MESSNRRSLSIADENISIFRRRNKIIAGFFALLIISLSLLITAAVLRLRHSYPPRIQPLLDFCSASRRAFQCLTTFKPIIPASYVTDPDQIFVISLQNAAAIIESSVAYDDQRFASNNCSNLLRHGLDGVGESLATMRVNPSVGLLSEEQRDEMKKRIAAAEDDVRSCVAEVVEMTAELADATEYLSSAFDFVVGNRKMGGFIYTLYDSHFPQVAMIYDNLFMFGLQLLFIIGLFCSLFRIR